jgi:hypothetical protein
MPIDTSVPKNWTPFRAVAALALWIVALATLALLASGCGGGSPPPSTNGSITLTWTITDKDHQPATCTEVSARSVALRLRNRASGAIVATAFPCGASPATAQVPAAIYDIDIALRASDGTTVATVPAQTGAVVAANRIKRLTPVTFVASTEGGLAISLTIPSSSSNCGSPTAGGAGITGSSIALERIAPGPARCQPVTFIRRIGAQQVGTYVANDCSRPAVGTCIERTETLTTTVPAGTYVIHVVGKAAARDCWKADATLTVTAGKPLPSTASLVRQPGC